MRVAVASEIDIDHRCNGGVTARIDAVQSGRRTCGASAVNACARGSQRFRHRISPRKGHPMPTPTTQQSPRSKASMVRAVSLHAAIVLASLIAASVTLVVCDPGPSHAQGAAGAGGSPPAAVVAMSPAATDLAMNYECVGQTVDSRDVEVRARAAGILLTRNFTERQRQEGPVAAQPGPGAVSGRAQSRRRRRGRYRSQARADHAHLEPPEAALGGARGEPARI